MRFFWKRLQRSPQPPVDRMQFMVQDFLKMFAYAVASGIAFSALAIAVTLAVSRNSDAQNRHEPSQWVRIDDAQSMFVLETEVEVTPENVEEEAPSTFAADREADAEPTPGSLYVGEGCGSEPVATLEREWFVTINGGVVEVEVQQVFLLPVRLTADSDDVEGLAEPRDVLWFHALLPNGARFVSLKLDTARDRRIGRWMDASTLDDRDQPLTNREIRTYIFAGAGVSALTTEPLGGLLDGETVVVTYRYQMPVVKDENGHHLRLMLASDMSDRDDDQVAVDQTLGTIWIEWKGLAAPSQLSVPHGTTVERRHGKVVGALWVSPRIGPAETFDLRWN